MGAAAAPQSLVPAPPGHCAALRRARASRVAVIPAGGRRCRKDRFLRFPRPLPSPSADVDVGRGSWRDAPTAAGRLLGAGAPRYLPSGAGAGALRAGCRLQPGRSGAPAWDCQFCLPQAAGDRRVTSSLHRSPLREPLQPLPFPRLLPRAWEGLEDARSRKRTSAPGEREGSVPGSGPGAGSIPSHASPSHPLHASPPTGSGPRTSRCWRPGLTC